MAHDKLGNKNKKVIIYLLVQLITTVALGLLISFLANNLFRISLFEWNWDDYINYPTVNRITMFWLETVVLFFTYLWLTTLLGSKWGAASLFILVSVGLSIANNQKMYFRGEPIYPSDLDMMKAIPSLLEMIDSQYVVGFILLLLLVLIITVFMIRKEWSFKKQNKNKMIDIGRVIAFIFLSFYMMILYNFNHPGNEIRAIFEPYTNWTNWSQSVNYQRNGLVSGVLYNLGTQSIEEPINYSIENLESIILKYSNRAEKENKNLLDKNEKNPNVIFIMNESFSDPDNLEKLSMVEYPLPYYKDLAENHMSGSILTEAYGGGTANVEFEALTSISMEPLALNITTPYIQMVDKMNKIPTTVSYFEKRGYRPVAIHPFNTKMYKRKEVYSSFGFEEFIEEETMQNVKKYENNDRVSDYSAYEEILYQLRKTNFKDFIFLVTMHNHNPYEGNYEDITLGVEGSSDLEIVEQYYQGLKYSDQDLRFLIDEIDKIEEETLIIFWGDHLPGIFPDDLFTKEHMLDKYETPLLIYTNFENNILNEGISIISPFYFMNYVSDTLNHPISGYTAFMKEMEKHLPAFKKGLYVEAETQSIITQRDNLTKESQKILQEYDMILYDLLEGDRNTVDAGFFESP